ncbi:hypothetical protein FSARC_6562 [Fusarium sarcochroum]|uniref:Uncharacterized protein n=1 Tax=Fusarium sarcochroum TaxID=1208366 RepID=A0A8H4TX72_9HYPO|nr:hypothetical protein FSARC_6562 [Fusarium sarcochroum]
MSPTFTQSAHLYKHLCAALKERRRSAESQQERPVLSTPFARASLAPTPTTSPVPAEASIKSAQTVAQWDSTLTQLAYADLRKVSTN